MTRKSDTMLPCRHCGREFKGEHARSQHELMKHDPNYRENPPREHLVRSEVSARVDLLDALGDDLPDGAYWALAQELGVEPEDML